MRLRMENKSQSVFEKLDKQSEQLEAISQKIDGISINDLHALAKRTWDYGDYQTAQKYYNYISLLNPLDWEASLYASLCNFKGYHNMNFWVNAPKQEEKIIVSTIKYINSLKLDDNKKEDEMARCIEIVKKKMIETKNHYFEFKDNYNKIDSDYIFVLEEYFFDVYSAIKEINLKAIKEYIIILAETCLTLIELTKKYLEKLRKKYMKN